MAKKIKANIIAVSDNDSEKLIEMGNMVKDKKAILQYYASDFFYYEVYNEPITTKPK